MSFVHCPLAALLLRPWCALLSADHTQCVAAAVRFGRLTLYRNPAQRAIALDRTHVPNQSCVTCLLQAPPLKWMRPPPLLLLRISDVSTFTKTYLDRKLLQLPSALA